MQMLLSKLFLAENDLTGQLPVTLRGMESLQYFRAGGNMVSLSPYIFLSVLFISTFSADADDFFVPVMGTNNRRSFLEKFQVIWAK